MHRDEENSEEIHNKISFENSNDYINKLKSTIKYLYVVKNDKKLYS